MPRPRILDLFCCAGGAGEGYHRAGFEVLGIDLIAQPRYPYPFQQANALDVLDRLVDGKTVSIAGAWYALDDFAALHASPPCQRYTAGTRATDRARHPDLVDPTRILLARSGLPYVIENVVGAPLLDPILLCGRQFGLTAQDEDGTRLHLDRHRNFETNWSLVAPPTCRPHDRSLQVAGAYGGARRDKAEARNVRHGGYVPSFAVQQALLGIDWTTEKELQQAIPPSYTAWIGSQLLAHLDATRGR